MASRGTVKVSPAMGKPRGEICVKVESDLSEQQCSCDLTGDEPVKRLEREIAALIQAEIQYALLKSKGAKVNVFDFAGALSRKDPRLPERPKRR